MSATVTWSLKGSPPCSWESLLGEGSISLKDMIPLLNHWSDYQSCSNQCMGFLCSPSCSSWDVAFFSSYWRMNLICLIHALKIGRMVMSVTYCDLRNGNQKSCDVWMICDVTSAVVSWKGLWLCPHWAEQDHCELLLQWLHLSQCCDLEQPLCKL